MHSEEKSKPSRIAKLIYVLIAIVTMVLIWAFVRSMELGRGEPTAEQTNPMVPAPDSKAAL
jgi:hypothetical protein